MKILFVAGGSPATVFALAPLATAVRNAGHETFMASIEKIMPFIAGAGLPGIALNSLTPPDYMHKDRSGAPLEFPTSQREERRYAGRGFARLGAASIEPLRELARSWRPDLVVGGSLSYAAGLLAAELGVPYVRHAWDPASTTQMDVGATQELQPELASLGRDTLPEPDLFIDICPESLRPPQAPPAQLMRWIPGNQQRRLEPWMYAKGERPRVCVTAGSQAADPYVREKNLQFMRALIRNVAVLDVEVVVAAPEEIAAEVRSDEVKAGWIPMDVLAPTCDVIMHHGGGVTSMTAMNAGVPQLIVPHLSHTVSPSRRMAEYGAAIVLMPDEVTADNSAEACRELLRNPSYRTRAREIQAEIGALPLPGELVGTLEKLTVGSPA
ncbi:nucleotide disphospho-sugar-binding domain-containing protein [Streptomyces sp. NPDC046821]|uniref:nucleotide disphospho-sugar-binding domain-containing protein n=1 Tax=Streptomyces sp. NPDC046821 TaxID=3154702 RepID=UPI0033FAD050